MSKAVFRFENPVPLNRDGLRRLSPIQGPLGYLTWDCISGKPEITGIEGRQGGDPCTFTIASPKNGALDLNWSCFRLVALRAGRVNCLSQASLPDLHTALNHLQQLMGDFAAVFLGSTIKAIASGGHGGAVWILRESRILGASRSASNPPRYRPLPERFEQRSKWLESVGHLAAVDGGPLLIRTCAFSGLGPLLIPGLAERGVFRIQSARYHEHRSKELGGGRHRWQWSFAAISLLQQQS